MLRKIISALTLAAAFVCLVLLVDRFLSRPSRINLEEQKDRLMDLNDAILSFTLDRERFPDDLSELVPGYVSNDMMCFLPDVRTGTREDILWDPETGMLSREAPFRIRGLFPRAEELMLQVRSLPVARDVLSGKNVFTMTSTQTALGEEDIVVEAERFQFMTYGWEIGENEDASGKCYIHIKEGTGDMAHDNVVFDPAIRSGDFFNITRDLRRIEARCYFMAPRAGSYFIAARTMSHRSTCSNIIRLQVNNGEDKEVGTNGSQPFVWLWHNVGQVYLRKGANFISFITWQDDVKVDQLVLTTKDLALGANSSLTFSGGYQQQPILPDDIALATLSLSVNTLAVTSTNDPEVFVYIHQNLPQDINGKLSICLDNPKYRKRERTHDIKLTDSDVLRRFPCEIDLPRPLEKKEYLLRCQLLVGSNVIQERTAVLFHGYDWSILGPLPFMEVSQVAEPENDARPGSSYTFGPKSHEWKKYNEVYTDHFCLMDFGRMFSGRTYHAIPDVSLYGYTEVEAKVDGDYLIKAQGDDNLVVWINGKQVVAITRYNETAIRNARETKVQLRAGRNRILFRLNQKQGQWQAGIRIRTLNDKVADVIGVPFHQQDVDFYK